MIRLYLVRHGIAEERGQSGAPDESRALTDKGRRRFRRAARAFAEEGEELDALYTSPLVRAVQTAEILAAALGEEEVSVLEELRPEVRAQALFDRVAREAKGARRIALVGHEPQMSAALVLAARLSPAEAQRLDFEKGAIVRIDVDRLPEPARATPRFWIGSSGLQKGLPLESTVGSR